MAYSQRDASQSSCSNVIERVRLCTKGGALPRNESVHIGHSLARQKFAMMAHITITIGCHQSKRLPEVCCE